MQLPLKITLNKFFSLIVKIKKIMNHKSFKIGYCLSENSMSRFNLQVKILLLKFPSFNQKPFIIS
jgi:hypothetical protein